VEILLWLAPAAVVTLVAMVWVAWRGRERRVEVDRDDAVRRLGEALSRPPVRPAGRSAEAVRPPGDRVTGVARRRTIPEDEGRQAS
jgi:hypothetical protein